MIEDIGHVICHICNKIKECKHVTATDAFGEEIKDNIYGKFWCSDCWELLDEIKRYRISHPYNNRVRHTGDGCSHPCVVCGTGIDSGLTICPGDAKCIRAAKRRDICIVSHIKSYDTGHNTFPRNGIHQFKKIDFNSHRIVYRCDCNAKKIVFREQLSSASSSSKYFKLFSNSINSKQNSFKLKRHLCSARTVIGALRHLCFKRDNYRCLECGSSKKDTPLEVDHIVPFSKGGKTTLENLQTLCKKCNRSKHTRTWRGGDMS